MKISEESLKNLASKYPGYLKGGEIDRFFDEFGIDFAAGHWCAGDFLDRFATEGYFPELSSDIIDQIERVAKAEIKGIEFHEKIFIDENYKKIPSKVEEVKEVLAKFKMTPICISLNLFTDPKWKLGGFTNPSKAVRDDALEIGYQCIELAKELGCSTVNCWPGQDGWDYNFEVNYGKLLDLFIEGCMAINKKAKENGLRFGIEAKLHEPMEGNIVISTTTKAILVAKTVNEECGGTNMGICIDYGHEQMYGVDPADMIYTAKRFAVPLTNFHLNTAKLHSNDEDRVAGTGDIWRMVDFCYAAIDTDYQGWFSEDQFTYRMDPVKAMYLSKEIFANLMKKALLIRAKRDELEAAQATGDAGATIDVVKEILI